MRVLSQQPPAQQQQPQRPEPRPPRQPLPQQPAPALLKLGYSGDMPSFNRRVDTIVQAHQKEFGYWPSPGLVLDVARATVHDTLLPHLFDGHSQPDVYGSLNKDRQQNLHHWLQPRGDEYLQHYSPFKPDQPNPDHLKKFPMVPEGYLPVPGFSGLVSAVHDINSADQQIKHVGTQSPYLAEHVANPDYRAYAEARGARDLGVGTVKGAQQHLMTLAPDYFGKLRADGNINTDWAQAIRHYQSSQRYTQDSLKQLARDNNLSVPDYVHAWTAKNKFVASNALLAHFASSVPIQFWAHHASVVNLPKGLLKYETGGVHGVGYVTMPIHAAIKTGELAFNVAGGTFGQLMSDTGAMNAYLDEIMPKWSGGSGASHAEAVRFAAEVARKNPTLLNTFVPDIAARLEGSKVLGEKGVRGVAEVDQLATFAAALLSGHPKMTGVRVAAGDQAGLAASRWFDTGTRFAYNSIRKGEPLGVAAKTLDGQAGERLLIAARDNPEMTLPQFRAKAAEMYHANEAIFNSLRSHATPTPRLVAKQHLQRAVGRMAADFEEGLRQSGFRGTDNAVRFARSVTNLGRRAVPQGRKVTMFGPTAGRSPDDIYNWAQKDLGTSTVEANQLRDEFIQLRAKDDVAGLQKFQDKLYALQREAHGRSDRTAVPGETFTPLIESDLPHTLRLPGREQLDLAHRIDRGLNKLARRHRQLIMFGPFQLTTGFKHAVADTGRRYAADIDQIFGLSAAGRAAESDLATLLAKDPAARRVHGQTREAAVQSEARWLTGSALADRQSFNLGELRGAGKLTDAHINGAAKYLRRHLNDEALGAYLKSSADNLAPLRGYTLGNKAVRDGILVNDPRYEAELEQLRTELAGQPFAKTKADIRAADVREQLAFDHAKILYARYKEIDQSLRDAGLTVQEAVGKTDKQVAALLKDSKVDLPVHSAEVTAETKWDALTRWWIGQIMRPNKWNRAKLFDYTLHETLGSMVANGSRIEDALPAAAEVALRQTVYHMLDFSNMLQAEQDFRWISYFATKHRLYWGWVAKHFAKNPGQAFALQQMANVLHLQNGNFNFTVDGHKMYLPVERLLWVNSRDYPETSPPIDALSHLFGNLGKGPQAALGAAVSGVSGTSGNILSRDDQAFLALYRWARAETGTGYSYHAATEGMSPTQQRVFADKMVEYAIGYQSEHGHLPTETSAAKVALLYTAATEFNRANFPLVVLQTGTPESIRHLEDGYGKLTDPAKKAAYLDAHPTLALWFGHQQPDVWWHNQPLWAKFNAARQQMETGKQQLLASAINPDGAYVLSPSVIQQMRKISGDWANAILELKAEDANSWQGNNTFAAGKAEKIKGTWQIQTAGPWTRQLEGDPLAAHAFLHKMFPNIPKAQLDAHSTTELTIQLQKARETIKQNPAAFGLSQQDAHTVLADINNQLAVLYGYPKDATGQAQRIYYSKYLLPYIRERNKRGAQPVASIDQASYDQQFRLWRQQHDRPVKITADGKTFVFPSVVQYGYAMAPAPVRAQYIKSFAHDNPLNLTPYELKMLGVKTPPQLAEAQTAFTETIASYEQNPNNPSLKADQKLGLAKQINNAYPGFYQFYLFATKPKIQRFELMAPYKQMPDRALFDQYVGGPAKSVVADIAAGGHRNYYEKAWRLYVKEQLVPWLKGEPVLNHELNQYGVNFLYTLVSNG